MYLFTEMANAKIHLLSFLQSSPIPIFPDENAKCKDLTPYLNTHNPASGYGLINIQKAVRMAKNLRISD